MASNDNKIEKVKKSNTNTKTLMPKLKIRGKIEDLGNEETLKVIETSFNTWITKINSRNSKLLPKEESKNVGRYHLTGDIKVDFLGRVTKCKNEIENASEDYLKVKNKYKNKLTQLIGKKAIKKSKEELKGNISDAILNLNGFITSWLNLSPPKNNNHNKDYYNKLQEIAKDQLKKGGSCDSLMDISKLCK